MKTAIVTMILPLAALVAVELTSEIAPVAATPDVVAAASSSPTTCRVSAGGELRLADANGERSLAGPHQFQSTHDGTRTIHAALNADGLRVLICDGDGTVVSAHAFGDDAVGAATAVAALRPLPGGRIFVELHVSPSGGLGVLIDSRSGERRVYEGHGFRWSDDGRDVAYVREPHHFDPTPAARAAVFINDQRLAEIPRDSGRQLTWGDDGSLDALVKGADGSQQRIPVAIAE